MVKTLATLSAVVLATLAACLSLGENDQVRVLRPPDKSVFPSGSVEIAVIVPSGTESPPIALDGQPLKLSLSLPQKEKSSRRRSGTGVFLPPASIIVRSLCPGLHRLRVGDATTEFFICDAEGKLSPPEGWSLYTPHPPPAKDDITCTACHELTERQNFTNMNKSSSMEAPSACFDCHERSEFSLTHNHRYESLAFCQMCHDPHGASRDHLMRIPKEKACTLCHD